MAGHESTNIFYPSSEKTINVLVVGETQQGKSTLISYITKLSGLSEIVIPTGNGSVSCTKDVTTYTFHLNPKSYQLVGPDGQPLDDGAEVQHLADLRGKDAFVQECPSGETDAEPSLHFRFIDTPGLNDSDGDDLQHMARILTQASELGYLNALVYVHNIDEPYSESFQKYFAYFQRSFPTFASAFIMVHTRVSGRKMAEATTRGIDLVEHQRRDLKAKTNADLEHFFVESKPLRSDPFSRFRSQNEVGHLLRHLSAQPPMPCGRFRLLKTPSMINVDRQIKIRLMELRRVLDSQRHTEEKNGLLDEIEIARLEAKVRSTQDRIRELSNPDIVYNVKSQRVDEDWRFGQLISTRKRAVEITADYDIQRVETTGKTWTASETEGKVFRGVLVAPSFGRLSGSVTLMTTGARKNKEAIDLLRANMEEDLQKIQTRKSNLILRSSGSSHRSRIESLGERLGRIEEMIRVIEDEEMSMDIWPTLRPTYESRTNLRMSQVLAFIGVYDEEVSSLMSREMH